MADVLELHVTQDVEEYASRVSPFLEQEPVERNLLCTVIEQARAGWPGWSAPPQFWWMSQGGVATAAASWTPPFPLLVSSTPASGVAPLAAAALDRAGELGVAMPAVVGPVDSARPIAHAMAERTGRRVAENVRLLLHALSEVLEVARPSGEARLATRDDAPLVVAWQRAFVVEVHTGFGADLEAAARASIDAGRVWLWVDGDVRSTAVQHPAVRGVVRIGVVYTPPAFRGNGYARGLVHDMSAAALRAPEVRMCALTTDATNPVSNAIYRQIGYVPVSEHGEYALIT